MGKKRKQKKRNVVRNAKENYERGMDLCLNEDNFDAALKYLLRAAKSGYKPAYGEIGIILYRENNETVKAEKWFRKAEKKNSLFPIAAFEYGLLFYLEKDDWKTGLEYLLRSAEQGCEVAYGYIGTILYLEKNKIYEAIEWFKKAEDANCLLAPGAYYYGLILSLDKNEWRQSLKYFQKSAEEGFVLAYGELGSLLYQEKIDIDEAEKWFKKAEEVGCLSAPDAYEYGMLLIKERGETERGKRYLDKAADDGY
ncbi:tetratricopeptide repeat protein [Desulfobacula sp.]|uniref:tetratricopeptide repeat protein n=1 Tax=Desulfobacula sp. TaxID=2593537 RepID=UPI0019CEC133|nr:SEL1-like repeat protein [Deltaproteobacteria bacterium]MBL6996395.1 SEL1-like repeat protein [Desulfobacula sp.]